MRYALRLIWRQPGSSLVIVLILTLAIGATTAIFAVVDAVYLRSLAVTHPEQLVLFSGDPFQGSISGSPPAGAWTLFSSEGYEFLLASGLLLILAVTLGSEYIGRWGMHRALFYEVSAGAFPFFLVSAARASKTRWAATMTALVYMGVTIAMILVLPLFRAQPLLGPIFVQVDRFMPPDFPLLLCVPALLIDVLVRRIKGRDWRLSLVLAIGFVAVFIVIQWPFADFLMSPWARNRFFISDQMPYSVDPVIQQRWYVVSQPDNLRRGIPIALALAFVSVRCGLWWGNWMSRVRR